ncbi:MAG: metal-dependent transcriptional regulator [Clostridia bacterium]
MKLQQSAENYLETILILSQKSTIVRSIDIVNELDFSKPSVSVAMKKLRENGFINVNGDGYITLTQTGKDIAESMYDKHKTLSEFLISLGVCEAVAKDDACKIEHIISQESFLKIKEFLEK